MNYRRVFYIICKLIIDRVKGNFDTLRWKTWQFFLEASWAHNYYKLSVLPVSEKLLKSMIKSSLVVIIWKKSKVNTIFPPSV